MLLILKKAKCVNVGAANACGVLLTYLTRMAGAVRFGCRTRHRGTGEGAVLSRLSCRAWRRDPYLQVCGFGDALQPVALVAHDFRVCRWDNTHSRFTSKTIRFHCHTVPLEEEEHEAIAAVEEAAHMKLPSLGHSVVTASQSDQQVIVFAFVPFSGVLIEPA